MDTCDEAAFQGVDHIRARYAKEVSEGTLDGSHSWATDMTDDELADYLHGYVTREEGWTGKDPGVRAWYDAERGVVILRKNPYSSTAHTMSIEEVYRKAGEEVRFAP